MSFRDFGLVFDQAQGLDANSVELDCQLADGFSIQAEYGAIAGVVGVQSRNHPNLPWRDVVDINSALTQPAGVAGGWVFEVGNARSKFYRVTWDYTSGTGAFQLAVHAKSGGI